MDTPIKVSSGSMIFASILALILGFAMLLYPGGTMALMDAAFITLQIIVTAFILAYAISEAVRYLKGGKKGAGIAALLLGVAAALLVWFFDVRIVSIVIALFFIVAGLGELFGGMGIPAARYFFVFLGLVNIMMGAVILKYPLALPLLIAWFVLFWGISRLCLALELRRMTS